MNQKGEDTASCHYSVYNVWHIILPQMLCCWKIAGKQCNYTLNLNMFLCWFINWFGPPIVYIEGGVEMIGIDLHENATKIIFIFIFYRKQICWQFYSVLSMMNQRLSSTRSTYLTTASIQLYSYAIITFIISNKSICFSRAVPII